MRALATADGDVFLPVPEPLSPVQYIFICMEPSLGGGSPEKARAEIEAGGRNFVNSIEDFLFHFSIRRYLCKPNERYHITDWSKGAMSVERAGIDRARRYDKWYSLLIDESTSSPCPTDACLPSARRSSGILFGAGFRDM